jgi:hypothetical protein
METRTTANDVRLRRSRGGVADIGYGFLVRLFGGAVSCRVSA